MEQVSALLDEVCGSAIRLVRAAPGTVTRLRLQQGEAIVEMEWTEAGGAGSAPAPAAAAVATAPPAELAPPAGVTYVRSPMIGTFYHAPGPGEPPFVRAGDVVEPGTQVGILEAMKLMNAIESDVAGRVVEVLVEDGTPVEYDQPLLALAPADEG
ncbi:acetyl-CoA carboxylase biotin carboxyl carrier protein [Actinoplanes sp. NPDC049316]|uniref:acetyl-CoA carboxylase biotin carboxyl carrier protein n=1 Tax=Actinoplanes sp. NPDC049316 TaxID=3154727 RepID=UPI00341C7DC2